MRLPTFPPLRVLVGTSVCGIALWLVGCAGPDVIVQSGQPPALFNPKPTATYEGKASYYWKPQPTASGERFDPEAMTAAHKTLPFQTMVRVTNLRNGKQCLVRITDRGPYIKGRIIDLSRAAAREIAMIKSGVVPVRVEVLKKIELVDKPNLRLTSQIKARGEALAREEADAAERARAEEKVKPRARAEGEGSGDRARVRRTRRM